jgi:hypothetical protein
MMDGYGGGLTDLEREDYLGRIENEDDVIAIEQHYGVPTNLLDFTFDPLVFRLSKSLTIR